MAQLKMFTQSIIEKTNLIGNGVVLDPITLRKECNDVAAMGVDGLGAVDCSLLVGHVSVEIDVRGGELFVAKPERDHGDVVSGEEEAHGGGVAQRVRGDVFASDRGAGACGDGEVTGEASFDRVAAEVFAGGGRE